MFVESLGSATLHNGIVRIECRVRGASGQDQVDGHLVIPAVSAIAVAQQLANILNELGKKVQEAKQAQEAQKAATGGNDQAPKA